LGTNIADLFFNIAVLNFLLQIHPALRN